MNWQEIKEKPSGTILHDEFDEGIRFIVMRGPCSLCAYVGVPIDHPLAGFNYEDLQVRAHGGLTFAGGGKGDGKYRPKDFYWYGWDYGHSGDKAFYYDDYPELLNPDDREWLIEDVIADSWETISDFKELAKLAEKIKSK